MSKEDNQLATVEQQTPAAGFAPTKENVELLKKTLGDVTLQDNELQLFLYQAKRTGLDPLARQIFVMKHSDRTTFMVSIDGQRLVAQRTGEYEGQVGPQWCGKDGKWRDVWLEDIPPAAARVGVYRSGFKEPVYGVATSRSYNTGKGVWRDKPDVMLAKCAEALALRKAFPQELAGLYTDEEMPAAEQSQQHVSLQEALKQAVSILANAGIESRDDKLAIIFGIAEIENIQQMTGDKMKRVLDTLKAEKVGDLALMYLPEPADEAIEGETAEEVAAPAVQDTDRDITDLYAEKQAQDAKADDQVAAVVYTVPSFPKGKNSKLIHPGQTKQIKEWIAELGLNVAETANLFTSTIGKPEPKNYDDAQTVLEALAEELNLRRAAQQADAA